jgi:Zn-dependent protease with chaperone function
MISVLKSLTRNSDLEALSGEFTAFGISGKQSAGFSRLFLSHPLLNERIRSLQQKKIQS